MVGNKTVSIRDDVAGAKPGLSVRWQMVTHTKISVNNNQATLQQNDRTLAVKIISPVGAHFEIASAQPPDDGVNQPNPNSQILVMNTRFRRPGVLPLKSSSSRRPSSGKIPALDIAALVLTQTR